MITARLLLTLCLLLSTLSPAPVLRADDATPPAGAATPKPLIDLSADGCQSKFVSDGADPNQVTLSHSATPAGVVVNIAAGGADYPGVHLKPDAPWDLSAFDHVEVTITNTGSEKMTVGVRVDDSGGWQDNNTEQAYLDPGTTQTIQVHFGMSYGKPGFAVNASSIAQVLIFTTKTDAAKTFRIESIQAAGTASKK